MKKIISLCSFIIVAFFLANSAESIPIIYTFEGKIISTPGNSTFINDAGYKIGDILTYKWLIDKQKKGYYVTNSSNIILMNDRVRTNGSKDDFFYSDLILGTNIQDKYAAFFSPTTVEIHYSEVYTSYPSNPYIVTFLHAGTSNIWQVLSGYGDIDEWDIGHKVMIEEHVHDWQNGKYQYLRIDGEFTSISPIPEPTTIFLFLIGVIGLIVLKISPNHNA